MAKYETTIAGSFEDIKAFIKKYLPVGSITFSWEEEFNGEIDNRKYWIVACERYAAFGGNRNSLNFTLIEDEKDNHLFATSTGGSQGMLLKLNTLSDNNFLGELISVINNYNN